MEDVSPAKQPYNEDLVKELMSILERYKVDMMAIKLHTIVAALKSNKMSIKGTSKALNISVRLIGTLTNIHLDGYGRWNYDGPYNKLSEDERFSIKQKSMAHNRKTNQPKKRIRRSHKVSHISQRIVDRGLSSFPSERP